MFCGVIRNIYLNQCKVFADPDVFNLEQSSVRKNPVYNGGDYTSFENVRTDNMQIGTSY